jgi:hypothetical protein
MARYTAWKKARPGRDDEILDVCLRQRREDSYGRKLKGYSLEELTAMPLAEFVRVKADGRLPSLRTPHGSTGWTKDGVTMCKCEDCETARADWRYRTGKD